MYESSFLPSKEVYSLLNTGNIIDNLESGSEMIERVVNTLCDEELRHSPANEVQNFEQLLGERMDDGRIIMSTPIMTNAGRYSDRPLGACTMPTTELTTSNLKQLKEEVDILHQQGMGTGFDLNPLDDPVSMLHLLNNIAIEGSRREEENRPVGNMAVLSVYHPKIQEFIACKLSQSGNENTWKFNISVDLDDNFFKQVDKNGYIELLDGSQIEAAKIFGNICEAAAECADPGLVFLDRMNARNPVPGIGTYKTTAPCAEVGLVEGESCQFGYLNIGKFIKNQNGLLYIDYDDLAESTKVLTKALDNALSISIDRYSYTKSVLVMQQKRKIGIGLSGVADAISLAGMDYGSNSARELIVDILSFINYTSKLSSVELARHRGPALAMNMQLGNLYFKDDGYLETMYGEKDSTSTVEDTQWHKLGKYIRKTGLLRNTTTIALPPTGRSALIYGASTGIEPHFSLERISPNIKTEIANIIGSRVGEIVASDQLHLYTNDTRVRKLIMCARDIPPEEHLAMVSSLQKYTDEAISKTINMPHGTKKEEVAEIYRKAYDNGTSGITVYVDGSHTLQPVALGKI